MKTEFSYPRGRFPRLCLVGNSNVGKSSLTRILLSHPQWYKGKIGKEPGSTLRLTIINDPALDYHVIDLPGFGKMLHVSKDTEMYAQKEILKYIELDRANIFLMILVISAERVGEELEKWFYQNQETIPLTIEFLQFFAEQAIPVALVLNKIDKLNSFQQKALDKTIQEVLHSTNLDQNLVFSHPKQDSNLKSSTPDDKNSNNLPGNMKGKEHPANGPVVIIKTSIKDQTGIHELKAFVAARAANLDLSQFDPRDQLMSMPPIDKLEKKGKK